MVKILSSGEIVQDDDPRANQGNRNANTNRRGQIRHTDYNAQEAAHGAAGEGQVSVFEVLNQKLLAAGLPRFNIGAYVVEPIATVGFFLAFLLFGFNGLLFGALLFAAVKLSSGGPGFSLQSLFGGAQGGNEGGPGNGRRPMGGGGQRLGRS